MLAIPRFWTICVLSDILRPAKSPENTLSLFRPLTTLQAQSRAGSRTQWPLCPVCPASARTLQSIQAHPSSPGRPASPFS